MDQEIRKGVKTFFLNADASLRPSPTQLQTLFLGGFEVYPLPETKLVPAADQIDCLVGLFRELIVFVNVDGVLPGGTWPELLVRLSRAYGARVRFGVLHHEADPARRSALERVYLVDVQVQAGCIFIDQTLSPDLPKLQRILVANDAIAFQAGSRRLEARVFEVSISNFLCVFKERDPELNESLRVKGIELALGSTTLKVDAIVLVKRIVGAAREMVYIFGFTGAKGDQLGLAPAETATVIGLIQSYTTQKIHELIDRAFQQRWKQRVLSSRSDPH